MNSKTRISTGAAVFCFFVALRVADLRLHVWAEALLLVAALVMVPMLLELIADRQSEDPTRATVLIAGPVLFVGGLSLVVSYTLPPGLWATVAALPWAGCLLFVAVVGARKAYARGFARADLWCRDAGMMYAAIGAAWLIADRLAYHPLGFDPAIVLLTAVHFHYAGLVLPVLAGLALGSMTPGWERNVISGSVIAGVPAVAFGITASQLHWDLRFEFAATWLMALAGAAVALLYLRMALRSPSRVLVRLLWGIAGVALLGGMGLALLYGSRNFFRPVPWLDLPWMRALHGTLNAVGFALPAILGWTLQRRAGEGAADFDGK